MNSIDINFSANVLATLTLQEELESSLQLLRKMYDEELRSLIQQLGKIRCEAQAFNQHYALRYFNSSLQLYKQKGNELAAQLQLRTPRPGELALRFFSVESVDEKEIKVLLTYYLSEAGPSLGWKVADKDPMSTATLANFCLVCLFDYAAHKINSQHR
jgi:hypothetical protein